MKKKGFILLITLALTMLSCSKAKSTLLDDSMDELLASINQEHQNIVKPNVNFDEFTSEYTERPFARYYASSTYKSQYQEEKILTFEEVEEDINTLFQALETNYGAYYYFGGKEKFNKVKESILKDCKIEVKNEFLLNTLLDKLSFIEDAHFKIEYQRLHPFDVPYFYRETAFKRDDKGLFEIGTDKYVETVIAEGMEMSDEVFKRSIAEDGSIVFYPILLGSKEESAPELTINYSDGSSKKLISEPYNDFVNYRENGVELYDNQSIPILYSRTQYFDEAAGGGRGRQFLQYADDLKDEPVAVVDLRYNGGGNNVIGFKWLEKYTGEKVTTNYVSIVNWTMDELKSWTTPNAGSSYNSYASMTNIAGWEPITPYYMKANAQPDNFISNDNLLIILASKSTWSASEMFVDMAHNVENAIIIGENTAGCIKGSYISEVLLPNSKILVGFGNMISIFPDDAYYQEFRGFEPDIWVPAGEAEELTIKFINKYMNE